MLNPLEIFQNNTISIPVAITEDVEINGEIVEQVKDLTEYDCYVSLKRNKMDSDDSAIVYKTWSTHIDAEQGETSIDFTSDDTSKTGTFDFEFGLIDATGGVNTILVSKIHVKPVVHREH